VTDVSELLHEKLLPWFR